MTVAISGGYRYLASLSLILLLFAVANISLAKPASPGRELNATELAALKTFLANQQFPTPLDWPTLKAEAWGSAKDGWVLEARLFNTPTLLPNGLCESMNFSFTRHPAKAWARLKDPVRYLSLAEQGVCPGAEANIWLGENVSDADALAILKSSRRILQQSLPMVWGATGCAVYVRNPFVLSGIQKISAEDFSRTRVRWVLHFRESDGRANVPGSPDLMISYTGTAADLSPWSADCPIR